MHAGKHPLNIYFRVDASTEIGSGHVMRCLTLAEALHSMGANIAFICRKHTGNLINLIQQSGFKTFPLDITLEESPDYLSSLGGSTKQDAKQCKEILVQQKADFLIIDHYAIGYQWQQLLRKTVGKILVIDDLANRKHDCDYLLDHNLQLPKRYDQLIPPTATRFLGVKYLLLRQEFQHKQKPLQRSTQHILITLGGSDAMNISAIILRIMMRPRFKHIPVDIVIGANNPHASQIRSLVQSRQATRLHIQTENISALMQQASLAIISGGITCYECLAMNLPALVITFADNQLPGIRLMDSKNIIRWAGHYNKLNEEELAAEISQMLNRPDATLPGSIEINRLMSQNYGPLIVSNWLVNGPPKHETTLRSVTPEDRKLLWLWANDSQVRQYAYQPAYIDWEEHKRWFQEVLNDPMTLIYIMTCKQGPIGQVRLRRTVHHGHDEYLLGYSIAKQYRGYGLGKWLIKLVLQQLEKGVPCTLIAHVKLDNQPSQKIFEALKFTKISSLQSHSCCYRKTLNASSSA